MPATHLLGLGLGLRSVDGGLCSGQAQVGKVGFSSLSPPHLLCLSPSTLPPGPPWVVPPLIVERDRPEVAPHTPVAYQSHANGAQCCMPPWYAYHTALRTATRAYPAAAAPCQGENNACPSASGAHQRWVEQGTKNTSRVPCTTNASWAFWGSLAFLHRCRGFCALKHCNTETLS